MVQIPVVIFDGQCEFCMQSLSWIQKRLVVEPLAFQDIDTQRYGLSRQQCQEQVFVIADGQTLGGADAIAYLLKLRGNKALSMLITRSGAIGRSGYRWVASHRNTWPIKVATKVLKALNSI